MVIVAAWHLALILVETCWLGDGSKFRTGVYFGALSMVVELRFHVTWYIVLSANKITLPVLQDCEYNLVTLIAPSQNFFLNATEISDFRCCRIILSLPSTHTHTATVHHLLRIANTNFPSVQRNLSEIVSTIEALRFNMPQERLSNEKVHVFSRSATFIFD